MNNEKALVIFSGGQDSTTCLIQAIQTYGRENVQTISFQYGQRHAVELERARSIAQDWGVKQTILDLSLIKHITQNALTDNTAAIQTAENGLPNTFVDGRNALFLLYAAICAKGQNIRHIITGVCETDFSGYPDCRDVFVKSMNVTLNLAMDYPFQIHTPLMYLTKAQTWELADKLGCLDYIRDHTHTCYNGVIGGCHQCPACQLRERGLAQYLQNTAAAPAFYDCEKSLTEHDLAQAEHTLSATLPDSFKAHYLKYNGGTPARTLFDAGGSGCDDIEISDFIPIRYTQAFADDPDFTLEGRAAAEWARNEIPPALIPFALDWGGNYICLEKDSGKIAYYVRDVWSDKLSREANFQSNTRPLADTFPAFLARLRDNPDDVDSDDE